MLSPLPLGREPPPHMAGSNNSRRSHILHRKRLVLMVTALIVTMGTATAAFASSLTGAGSTLITPLMQQWESHSGISITYGSIGSGKGIAAITSRSVNFGASDAPLTPAQAAACNNCV